LHALLNETALFGIPFAALLFIFEQMIPWLLSLYKMVCTCRLEWMCKNCFDFRVYILWG
jgi:H+/Cl- antiporter ClcA